MPEQTVRATITLDAQDQEHAQRIVAGTLERYNATVTFDQDDDDDDDDGEEARG